MFVAVWRTFHVVLQCQNMAAAGDGDVAMAAGDAEADFTARLKLALESFPIPDAMRKNRSPDVVKKFAFIKLCENPVYCPLVFEHRDMGLFLPRRNFDGRYSIPATFGCTQHLEIKIGMDNDVKIFSVCSLNGCSKETPCDGCDMGNTVKHILHVHPDFVPYTAGEGAAGEGAAGAGAGGKAKRVRTAMDDATVSVRSISETATICAHAAVLSAWPGAIFGSAGMEHLFDKLVPGPLPSASTVRRHIARDVLATMQVASSELRRALEPTTVTIEGETFRLRVPSQLVVDKWTGNGGRNFMVDALTRASYSDGGETVAEPPTKPPGAGKLPVAKTRKVPTMRPGFSVISMDHYKAEVGADDNHDRHMHRKFYGKALTKVGLSVDDLLALGADTEGVNFASVYSGNTLEVISEVPLVTRLWDFRGVGFVPCAAHEANSIGTHCSRVEAMMRMLAAAEELSGHVNATDKRMEALRQVARLLWFVLLWFVRGIDLNVAPCVVLTLVRFVSIKLGATCS